MNKLYNPQTKEITDAPEHHFLKFLYHTIPGRVILKIITLPFISQFFGFITNRRISKLYINHFIKKNHIVMTDYPKTAYQSFNDFFTRHILPDKRPFSANPQELIAPADAKLTAYHINKDLTLNIKNSQYTIANLIQDPKLAKEYENGTCLVFRLCVDDYHRYIFIDDGQIINSQSIKGKLHTVNPIALAKVPVFTENHRVVTTLKTSNFAKVIYIEVGALNVGKIHNQPLKKFKKGEEKGHFSFGASTIILLFKKDCIAIDQLYYDHTNENIETIVKQGMTIGLKKS